eukprot:TRINITY_DN2179_c0_g1_i1.p1 TRINITY_DN2179_c0_g1~~TRINITY_DN2179_c0_g1_i1.p1  ORF type:complete len:491 (-),score=38.57 TRINITY_DN2179_c0_g1_i1:382-1854(-)
MTFQQISLLGSHLFYVCAEPDGRAVCNRSGLGPWVTFDLIPLGGDKVAIKSAHGTYLGAEGGQVSFGGDFEAWTLCFRGGAVALRARTGEYLSAQPDGRLEMNGDGLGPWQLFELPPHFVAQVSIRGPFGMYVGASQNGRITCDRSVCGPWETFLFIRLDGNQCALLSSHGYYVTAQEMGRCQVGDVVCTQTDLGTRETWSMHLSNGSCMLRSWQRYLGARPDGGLGVQWSSPGPSGNFVVAFQFGTIPLPVRQTISRNRSPTVDYGPPPDHNDDEDEDDNMDDDEDTDNHDDVDDNNYDDPEDFDDDNDDQDGADDSDSLLTRIHDEVQAILHQEKFRHEPSAFKSRMALRPLLLSDASMPPMDILTELPVERSQNLQNCSTNRGSAGTSDSVNVNPNGDGSGYDSNPLMDAEYPIDRGTHVPALSIAQQTSGLQMGLRLKGDVAIDRQVGKGSYGVVYRGTWQVTTFSKSRCVPLGLWSYIRGRVAVS